MSPPPGDCPTSLAAHASSHESGGDHSVARAWDLVCVPGAEHGQQASAMSSNYRLVRPARGAAVKITQPQASRGAIVA